MKIAVAGATGTIGTKICTELEKRGHQVVPLSRSTGVDASVLESLTPALAGVDVVIDALNHTVMNRRKAEELFKLTASNIAQAAAENQVKRIVCISIAGVQDAAVCRGYGYYSGKAVQENTYKASPVETMIIHSAQWFEILPTLVKQVTFGPVSVLPTMKMSPLPAAPGAQLACDIAEGQMNIPDSGVISIRGAEEGTAAEFVKRILAARGEIGGNLFIKLPVTREGFAAIPRIVREGMQVTATGIHSSMQGFMAAKAGARYVAPYVNRMDNYGIDGVRVASEIHRTLRSYDLKADVLAASFKNSEQVLELVRQGVGAITAAPDVLAALIKNPATDAAIADQNRDFGFLVGERRTWLDLIKEK